MRASHPKANPLVIVFLASAVGALLLSVFFFWFPPEAGSLDAETATTRVRDFLKVLPLRADVILLFWAIILTWIGWRVKLYAQLKEEISDTKKAGERVLDELGWRTVSALRRRAFVLRQTGSVILGAVFILLFTGSYVVLFILPKVLQDDRSYMFSDRFAQRFSSTLEAFVEGEQWIVVERPAIEVRTNTVSTNVVESFREIAREVVPLTGVPTQVTHAGKGARCRLAGGDRVGEGAFDQDNETVLCSESGSLVVMRYDGASGWVKETLPALSELSAEFKPEVVASVVSSDGAIVVVVDEYGLVSSYRNEEWQTEGVVSLRPTEDVLEVEMSSAGERGVGGR